MIVNDIQITENKLQNCWFSSREQNPYSVEIIINNQVINEGEGKLRIILSSLDSIMNSIRLGQIRKSIDVFITSHYNDHDLTTNVILKKIIIEDSYLFHFEFINDINYDNNSEYVFKFGFTSFHVEKKGIEF